MNFPIMNFCLMKIMNFISSFNFHYFCTNLLTKSIALESALLINNSIGLRGLCGIFSSTDVA